LIWSGVLVVVPVEGIGAEHCLELKGFDFLKLVFFLALFIVYRKPPLHRSFRRAFNGQQSAVLAIDKEIINQCICHRLINTLIYSRASINSLRSSRGLDQYTTLSSKMSIYLPSLAAYGDPPPPAPRAAAAAQQHENTSSSFIKPPLTPHCGAA
jgi:hypothetical protein